MEKQVSLISIFIPVYFNMLLSIITLMINTYMISLIDHNLVGAMGAGNQIFSLFINIFNLLAVGCSVLVSQAIGAKDKKTAIRAVHISIMLNAGLGIICSIFIFFFANLVLKLLQVPQDVFNESYKYLRIISLIFAIDATAVVLIAVIRAYGYASHTMFVSIIINIITICGNTIALFEPFGLPFFGLSGVGISTITGRILGVCMLLFVLIKVVKIPLFISLFVNIRLYLLKKILSIGIPSAGENLIWVIQYLIAFSFVASMGSNSLTTQTIYFQISAFIFFASSAIGIANEVIVARLVGAKENEKAYHQSFKALKIGFLITAIFLGVVFLNKNLIMSAFNLPNSVKELMLPLFFLSIILEFGRTQNVIMVNALRASGDAKFPFYMGIIFMWGVSIPLGWFLGIYLEMGILGVWIGFLADEWLRGSINTLRWKSKKWQEKKLI
ncbi:MATE family efflux transporter [Campylobacter sp. FMV-PI01]|uniref:MATE family efflux transporter n=1 Tax=Campylobacter portucalensis TaxID=2608384 RepID=A0A6L5WIU2_9BACT|nr:MATE family efflux transporter [Campylobacter portucalensis]MSN96954.1 MATE family efflux transporter [Campylobacter portucalensis]